MISYMPIRRTALFLKEQQLAKLQKLSEKTGAPVAELVRRAIEVEDGELSAEEKAVLDRRLADFHHSPNSGTPAEQLKSEVLQRLKPR